MVEQKALSPHHQWYIDKTVLKFLHCRQKHILMIFHNVRPVMTIKIQSLLVWHVPKPFTVKPMTCSAKWDAMTNFEMNVRKKLRLNISFEGIWHLIIDDILLLLWSSHCLWIWQAFQDSWTIYLSQDMRGAWWLWMVWQEVWQLLHDTLVWIQRVLDIDPLVCSATKLVSTPCSSKTICFCSMFSCISWNTPIPDNEIKVCTNCTCTTGLQAIDSTDKFCLHRFQQLVDISKSILQLLHLKCPIFFTLDMIGYLELLLFEWWHCKKLGTALTRFGCGRTYWYTMFFFKFIVAAPTIIIWVWQIHESILLCWLSQHLQCRFIITVRAVNIDPTCILTFWAYSMSM